MKDSRRDFLKKTGGCALGMIGLATQMQHLGAMSAMAQRTIDDQPEGGQNYKALVLLYMQGGTDGNNMIIPMHNDGTISNYAAYSAARSTQGLALTQAELANTQINVPRQGNLPYALHPNFGAITQNGTTIVNNGIHELWAQGKLGAVTNVGNLVQPLTKAQYLASSTVRPYQLFSHSDQVTQSQTSNAKTQAFTGWGGRVSDRLTLGSNPNGLIPMVTSIAGAQLFTAGQTTLPLAIADSNTSLANVLNPAGFTSTANFGPQRLTAFNALRSVDLDSNYYKSASYVTDKAMAANAALAGGLETTNTPVPNSGLARQLRQVARLIKTRDPLNINRQIFYVQVGSFDTHTNQLANQGNLITQVSQALRWFWDELVAQGIQNDVTTFTLSDFCRTLNPAGTGAAVVGSDHAWGNHMFVMGGSVVGGNFYGSLRPDGSGNYFPTLAFGGNDDVDTGTAARGRWLPTTSVDQYAATLARWFGLAQDTATLNAVFPNLANFPGSFSQLGFLP